MGGGEKGNRGVVDRALECDVMGQNQPPLSLRRPVRAESAHVPQRGRGRFEGRQASALGDLAPGAPP
jgi:hypothetical protein